MAGRADTTLPATRRPRKSTGHSPVRKRIEKENITVDMASSLAGNAGRKKLRSKSMGPGGLDVLKAGSGNRRVSLAAPTRPPPRSILKPTIPPLPEIPPHKPKASTQGIDKLHNPFHNDDSSSGKKIALRTEEEQQAAAREREERERAELEKEINDRREARRKSLANRRVSFAAEATLHTFHEIEYMQDSTTSTDSTRRASSLATQSPANAQFDPHASQASGRQAEDIVPGSPDDQQDDTQKKRRRSSGMGTLTYSHNEDDTLASTVYSSDSEVTEGIIEDVDSDSGSDSDADEVSVDLDVDEVTGTTVASLSSIMSGQSDLTMGSNDTLDDALRLAANRAVTQSLDEDEEVIPSFGWVKKPTTKQAAPSQGHESSTSHGNNHNDSDDTAMTLGSEMDMTRAVGGILESQDVTQGDEEDAELSMDVTRALGGILPQLKPQVPANSSESKTSEPDDLPEDATMDLTMAVGGIHKSRVSEASILEFDDNEDMSMELTTIMGGVLPSKRKSLPSRRRTLTTSEDDETMDITVGIGRILPTSTDDSQKDNESTMGMDMTLAVGGIIAGQPPATARTQAKQVMEEEVDESDATTPRANSTAKKQVSNGVSQPVLDAESPASQASRTRGLRQSLRSRASTTPQKASPAKTRQTAGPASSEKTPRATQNPSTPLKTPPSKRTPLRTASPKRSNMKGPTPAPAPSTASKDGKQASPFKRNVGTNIMSPLIVLTPQQRRLSGVGADRSGLGSPRVAAIFERRESIGDAAEMFVPGENRGTQRGVSFADPRVMNEDFEREQRQDSDKENGAEDENSTATLKDMISSMTPKKNLLRGRKSLHVGSAAGLLGKRPFELDEDDDEGEPQDGIKRLKNHQGSPVKNVRLHAPPTKEETTGRMDRLIDSGQDDTWTKSITSGRSLSPKKKALSGASPKGKMYLNFVESDLPTGTLSFEDTLALRNMDDDDEGESDENRIHLQDFLNMTSIRFMELTTTKRRHTQAPQPQRDSLSSQRGEVSLEQRVVAGACTVPMLELYQHSCRELKKYISEGRRIIREIETETLEENPPLFQEYINATPDFKVLMDNQFKNVKTHARFLSKAMWYEWRMKLQDGLKEGLERIAEGMDSDEKLLNKEQKLLDSVLPGLLKHFESLELEQNNLQSAAAELADCDPEDLEAARTELRDVDEDVNAKIAKIEALRQQLSETEASIEEISWKKVECLAEIEESEKIREECRGWTSNEVSFLKAKVDNLEKQRGWMITGISDTMVSMTYLREIELVFDISSFHGLKPESQIDLWYIAASRDRDPIPATADKEFFVQCIRDHVRSFSQAQTKVNDLLSAVSTTWDMGNCVARNMRLLNSTFPTTVNRISDSSIAVRSNLLLAPLQTKVEISLGLRGSSTPAGVEVAITPQARIVYGEHFKLDKVVEYLTTRLGTKVDTKKGEDQMELWSDVVVELHERMLARGGK